VYWHDEISVKRRVDAMELERLNENVGTEVAVWHGTWVTLAVADTSDFILEHATAIGKKLYQAEFHSSRAINVKFAAYSAKNRLKHHRNPIPFWRRAKLRPSTFALSLVNTHWQLVDHFRL
jgi:hypothetical protein